MITPRELKKLNKLPPIGRYRLACLEFYVDMSDNYWGTDSIWKTYIRLGLVYMRQSTVTVSVTDDLPSQFFRYGLTTKGESYIRTFDPEEIVGWALANEKHLMAIKWMSRLQPEHLPQYITHSASHIRAAAIARADYIQQARDELSKTNGGNILYDDG